MPQNRRTFLHSLAGVAGVLVTRDAPAVTRAVRPRARRLGLQFYTVRAELQRDFPGTIARVAERVMGKDVDYERAPSEDFAAQ
jgi:hypothetical protein